MAAPKGNKNARGTPPTVISNEDLHKLGKEMLEWLFSKKKDNDLVHLSQWYSEVKEIDRTKWHAIRQRIEFKHYYERAMDFLACKVMTNQKLNTAYGSRYLAIYEKDVRDFETEEKKAEYKRKKDLADHEAKLKETASMKSTNSPNDSSLTDILTSLKELGKKS